MGCGDDLENDNPSGSNFSGKPDDVNDLYSIIEHRTSHEIRSVIVLTIFGRAPTSREPSFLESHRQILTSISFHPVGRPPAATFGVTPAIVDDALPRLSTNLINIQSFSSFRPNNSLYWKIEGWAVI
jgi:hypothetical protein